MTALEASFLAHVHMLILHYGGRLFRSDEEGVVQLEHRILHEVLNQLVVIEPHTKTAVYVHMTPGKLEYPTHRVELSTMWKTQNTCVRNGLIARVLSRLAVEQGAQLHEVDHGLGDDIVTYAALVDEAVFFQVTFFKVN